METPFYSCQSKPSLNHQLSSDLGVGVGRLVSEFVVNLLKTMVQEDSIWQTLKSGMRCKGTVVKAGVKYQAARAKSLNCSIPNFISKIEIKRPTPRTLRIKCDN